MKKTLVLIAAAATMLATVSCKKDGVFNPKEKIHYVYTEATTVTYESYNTNNPVAVDTAITKQYKSQEYVWDGKKLTEIKYFDPKGDDLGSTKLTYDGKQLSKVESGKMTMTYNYKGSKLTTMEVMQNSESLMTIDVEHDGKKISKLTANIAAAAMENLDSLDLLFTKNALKLAVPEKAAEALVSQKSAKASLSVSVTMTFTYEDKNLTKIDMSGVMGFASGSMSFTYDNKKNPMQGCYAMFGPTALSQNNVVKTTMGTESDELKYTYNADDYPETVTSTEWNEPEGNYKYEITTTQTYEYMD